MMASQDNILLQMATDYDRLPYQSFVYHKSHPNHLAALAIYHNITPVNPFQCRILEIGCAIGNNIISYAEHHPNCTLVGIDLSGEQIKRGQELIARARLKNVTLQHCSITDFKNYRKKFDYIICHGVFSWVPDFVQQKILAYIKRNLSPHGMAYISYNCLPGAQNLKTIRDMMLFARQSLPQHNHDEDMAHAFDMLHNIGEISALGKSHYYKIIKDEIDNIKTHNNAYINHEYYTPYNQPLYFHQFCDLIEQHKLGYLCNGDISNDYYLYMFQHARDWFDKLTKNYPNLSRRDQIQYIDFFTNQRFRGAVITHDKIAQKASSNKNHLRDLYVNMDIILAENQPRPTYPLTHDECRFNAHGNDFTCDHKLLTAIYLNLVDSGNQPITGNGLIAKVKQTDGCAEYFEKEPVDAEQIVLRELENSLHRGLLTIDSQSVHIDETPPDYPDLGRFSFAQMQDQDWFICPNGKIEKIYGLQKIFYPLLNGDYCLADIHRFLDEPNNFKTVKMDNYDGHNPQDLPIIQQKTQQQCLKLLDILNHEGVFATYHRHPSLVFYKAKKA